MSIEEQIEWWKSAGGLFSVRPLAAGAVARRTLLVTKPLWDALEAPWDDEVEEERFSRLRADLDFFVEGGRIDPTYFKRLWPPRDCPWEIRSVRPSPSIRVLGRFAQRDVFIATTYERRSELGRFESREWKDAKRRALAEWRKLFPTYNALDGSSIHDLVSNASTGEFFRQ